jgi:hypothetical protein
MGLFKKKKKKSQFKFFEKEKFVYQKIAGSTNYNDFIQGIKEVLECELYRKDYNWIINVKNSKATFKPGEMEPIIDFIKKNKDKFESSRIALIIGNPRHYMSAQAISEYFDANDFGLKIRVFSVMSAAKNWVTE